MAKELFRARRSSGRVVGRGECGYALLLAGRFFRLFCKDPAQAFVTGAEPPALDEEHGKLDACRCP